MGLHEASEDVARTLAVRLEATGGLEPRRDLI